MLEVAMSIDRAKWFDADTQTKDATTILEDGNV